MKLISQLIFFSFFTTILHSQAIDVKTLNNYFDSLRTYEKFMGTVHINKNGKSIYDNAVGWSNIDLKIKNTSNSIFRIGSITKTFTATLIMKAVEEKKLDLDQSILSFFPELTNSKIITIRNMLQHTSGIYSVTDEKDYLEWCTKPMSQEALYNIMLKGKSKFVPETRNEYSNSNYILLTWILEKVYGKSYEELLEKYIIKPAKLTSTFITNDIPNTPKHTTSYHWLNAWEPMPNTDKSIPLGAGAISSTASDITKFMDALFDGKLIKKSSLDIMKKTNDDFGLGLFKIPFDDKYGYGHTGGIDGYTTIVVHYPDIDATITVLSNGNNFSTNNIAIALSQALYNKEIELPDLRTVEVEHHILQSYTGVYASDKLPLKLTITKNDAGLIAQGTNQPSFPLTAKSNDTFSFEPAGILITFDVEKNRLVLKQGGTEYIFVRE